MNETREQIRLTDATDTTPMKPFPENQMDTREQIRMKLWVDVRKTPGAGKQHADAAVKDFDMSFPEGSGDQRQKLECPRCSTEFAPVYLDSLGCQKCGLEAISPVIPD